MDYREINSSEYDLYASQVADIHLEAYSLKHMTAHFSKKKIEEYYRCLTENCELFIIASETREETVSGQVVGFIVAGPNISKGVDLFLKDNRYYVLWLMLRNPSFLLQKTITIVRSKILKSKPSIANFRLLSIAVRDRDQSHGVGKGMLQFFEKILKGKGVSLYGLSVRNQNHRAVSFYKRNGFLMEKEVSRTRYYIRKVN